MKWPLMELSHIFQNLNWSKAKLQLGVVKHQEIKTFEGVKDMATDTLNVVSGWSGWSASRLSRFIFRDRSTGTN
jgi:hypothetical protein